MKDPGREGAHHLHDFPLRMSPTPPPLWGEGEPGPMRKAWHSAWPKAGLRAGETIWGNASHFSMEHLQVRKTCYFLSR